MDKAQLTGCCFETGKTSASTYQPSSVAVVSEPLLTSLTQRRVSSVIRCPGHLTEKNLPLPRVGGLRVDDEFRSTCRRLRFGWRLIRSHDDVLGPAIIPDQQARERHPEREWNGLYAWGE
jgi:hypothetical protein